MKTIKVDLKENSYSIIAGSSALSGLAAALKRLKLGPDIFIVTNSFLKRRYGSVLEKSLSGSGFSIEYELVPDSEKSKSLARAARILSRLTGYDRKKKILILAFGGGVIGDLSGFVASIYRRGTAYVQVPTTLLAQVDSSIGGKTAVDLSAGKNLAGTFYQPRLVLSDIDLLRSLSARQISSALAEVIKYGLIGDRLLFAYLEKNMQRILAKDRACLEFIVLRCAAAKAKIVSRDEKEKLGLRTILNFGHTMGHAIEAAGKFSRYNHGEAVGLGMICAASISRALGLLSVSEEKRLAALIKRAGLPIKIKGLDPEKIIASHFHDKKFSGSQNKFVLLKKIGKSVIRENIPLEVINEALKRMF